MKIKKLIYLSILLSLTLSCNDNTDDIKLSKNSHTEISYNTKNLDNLKQERTNKKSETPSSKLLNQDILEGKYNETIYVQGYLLSENGNYKLILQGDGNLVLYRTSNNQALWASNTTGTNAYKLVMQSDGNLVLYGKKQNWWGISDVALWESKTYYNGGGIPDQKKGDYAILQNDGNFVIYNTYGFKYPIWASGTNQ